MQLGTRRLALPLIQGGMGVGISLGNLAGSVAKEGGMGVISTANIGFREDDFWQNAKQANSRALAAEIEKAKAIAHGAGLVAINAMVATADYANAVKTAIAAGVDAIISGAGLPMELPMLANGADVLLAPIVSSGRAASVICRSWQMHYQRLPDFVVLEGSEAGGHLGFSRKELDDGSAKPLSALLADVLNAVAAFGKIPVFVAGGISDGAQICHYINEGAAGAQIATRFITTEECDASDGYKEVFLHAESSDICIVNSPVGMPGRALFTPLVKKLAQGETFPPTQCVNCLVPCNPAKTPYCITRALIEAAKGNFEEGLFFCGAHAGGAKKLVTVKTLIDEIMQPWREL